MTELEQWLASGGVLITPSQRLATLLSARYAGTYVGEESSWQAPNIVPLSAWLADLYRAHQRDHDDGRFLLSLEQAQAVWESVIERDAEPSITNVESLAQLAADAALSAALWQLPQAPSFVSDSLEVSAYQRWRFGFERRCEALQVEDEAMFVSWLCRSEQSDWMANLRFRFYGFPRLPSSLALWQQRATTTAAIVSSAQNDSALAIPYRVYSSSESEIEAAMQWAVAQKKALPECDVTLAVGRADAGLRRNLRAAFNRCRDASADAALAFDDGDSVALSQVPVIEDALRLLNANDVRQWHDISRLLLSPYWGRAAEERDARAQLDFVLRRYENTEVSINRLMSMAAEAPFACPLLVQHLQAMSDLRQALPRKQRLHDWLRFAEELLARANWPGQLDLNDAEQSAMNGWQRCLNNVAALDALIAPVTWEQALARLKRGLRRTRVRPSAPIAAIKLLDLDEARALRPQALWVLGLNDASWPNIEYANPMLPLPLQRQAGVPGADPARDLSHAVEVIADVLTRDEVVWSFAELDGDLPRRAFAASQATFSRPAPAEMTTSVAFPMERILDEFAPALTEPCEIRGGASLFADQAACPFRAVARYRLGAATPLDAKAGLSAAQRGNLIHAALAHFWQSMKSSTTLAAASESQLMKCLETSADRAIRSIKRDCRLLDTYWDLERQRLIERLGECLVVEATRGEFEVLACERAELTSINGLQIKTRIDRIDRLADGSEIVLDYKTGQVHATSWLPPRPDQPQLPLYALTLDGGAADAIAFFQVRKGQCRIVDKPKGRASGRELGEAELSDWQESRAQWRNELDQLAQEIRAGAAQVAPKNGSKTCRYCDLQAFCRISEQATSQSFIETDGDE